MDYLRASTRRADGERKVQRESPGYVPTVPTGNGHGRARPGSGVEHNGHGQNGYARTGSGLNAYRYDGDRQVRYRQNGHRQAAYRDNDPRAPIRRDISWPGLAAIAFLAIANVLAVTGTHLQPFSSTIGFWFILVYPAYLLYTTSFWPVRPVAERIGYSLGIVILLLILMGLAVNTALPSLGVQHPLGHLPVTVLGDAIVIALALVRRRYPGSLTWWRTIRTRVPAEMRLIGGSVLCVVLAVMGATRLNNNAGSFVSIVALVVMAVVLALLLWRCQQIRETAIAASIYFISLALLLLTSLRGWYISGHDIQVEYRAFQLVVAHGRWDYSLFPNAYNGCLSITILPTEIVDATNIYDAYVFKVIFQILFALVPVLVYTISRRYWSKPISVLAAAYFISLPNFFTDMTYENRQETAFIFVCAGILAVTNSSWRQPKRRVALLAAALGIELSHYSTMYMFIGAVAGAWIFGSVLRLLRLRASRRSAYSLLKTPWTGATRTVGAATVIAICSISLLWGGLVTHTTGNAVKTVADSISELFTPGAGSSPQYDLFSRAAPSEAALLAGYRHDALALNQLSKAGTYIPFAVAQGYPTPLVQEPLLPSTSLGRLLSHVGISAETVNTLVRGSAAKDEQLFVVVGLAAVILMATLRRRVPREYFCLCVGSAFMMGLFVIFPNLSADYGLLRAFQETLIVLAPVLVEGSLAIFRPLGDRWSLKLTCAVAVVVFISTTGLMPQLLGGYAPQLSLDNSGDYYDEYYLHPQEMAAESWLSGEPGVLPDGLAAAMPTVFAFNSTSDVTGDQVVSNIYPATIPESSWVLLNYAIVHDDRAVISVGNDAISYAYPTAILEANKNLVYNNGGAEIYR